MNFPDTTDNQYRYPTLVRHQGTVLALAMDDQSADIYYRVLALDPAEPNDDKSWSSRQKVSFPDEIRPAGLSLVTVERKLLRHKRPSRRFLMASMSTSSASRSTIHSMLTVLSLTPIKSCSAPTGRRATSAAASVISPPAARIRWVCAIWKMRRFLSQPWRLPESTI
jgi:hypothetical protein